MKTFYLLLVAAAISITSCRTKEGTPGPAGESILNKQGSVSGSLAYVDSEGDSINVPFNYEYFESLTENTFSYNEYNYLADFNRRGAMDNNNYISFPSIEGETNNNGKFDAPYDLGFNFSIVKNINNKLFEFSGSVPYDSDSECIITNFSLDTLSGRMVFDFETYYDANDIDYESRHDYYTPAVVKGHVDVSLYKKKFIYLD